MSTPAPTFDRATANAAGMALRAALAELNIGYDLEVGSGSFSGSELTVQLKVRIPGGQSPERVLLEEMCRVYGIDPAAKLFSEHYGHFTLSGYHVRRPKYPWTVTCESGQRYKFTTEAVKDAFKRLTS